MIRLVLVSPQGVPVGVLRPYAVRQPWWQEVREVVAGARAAYGIDVMVLRLLAADRPRPPGGTVTYLAEYDGPAPAGSDQPADSPEWTKREPLRMPWANPGGPAASLAWAGRVLGGIGAAVQRRTWNLSAIWRVDGAWLKEVPPFFAHESAVLGWLAGNLPEVAPRLLGADGTRMVLEDVPGTDRYGAGPEETVTMLDRVHAVHVAAAGRIEELLALGVPDRRGEVFTMAARAVLDAWAHRLSPAERVALARLVDRLPERFAAVAACGIPDTLVHGDFHSGNVRSDGSRQVILDWGDSIIGHPATDLLTLTEATAAQHRRTLHAHWCAQWRAAEPASRPERALELMRPVEALRAATLYAGFLDAIEPAEHPYHAADPLRYLQKAAKALPPPA